MANLLISLFLAGIMYIIDVDSSLTYHWPVTNSSPLQALVGSVNLNSPNPEYVKDRFGMENSALRVTSVNNYIYTPSAYLLSSSFSISIWMIAYNNQANWARVFDFSVNTNTYVNLAYSVGTSGKPRFAISNPGYNSIDSSEVLTNVVWNHFVVTATPNSAKFYINQNLIGSITFSTSCNYPGYGPTNYFGRSATSTDWYANCDYDDIKIYDHVLSPAEVANEYQNASSIFKSQVDTSFYRYLAHYWPINGNAVDVVAGADLDSYNPTWTSDRFGNANGAFKVSDSSSHFWAPSGYYFNTTTGFSVTLWVKPYNFTDWSRIFDFGNGAGIDNYMMVFVTSSSYIAANSPLASSVLIYQNSLTANAWYHFCFTSVNNLTTIYINGVLAAQGIVPLVNTKRYINFFGKSAYAWTEPDTNADFDEIKFFDTVLTQQQVVYDYLTTTVPYTTQSISKPVSPITNPSFYQYMIHYWPIENQDYTDHVNRFDLKPISSQGYVKDRFRNENSAYSATSSSYFDASPGIYLYNQFTLTCWVNLLSTSVQDIHLFDFSVDYGHNRARLILHLRNTLNFRLYNLDGTLIGQGDWQSVQGSRWHHVALSVNSSTATLYLNGANVASSTLSSPVAKILRTQNFIGHGGSGVMTGYLDDIKIFNVSLSGEEIYYDYSQKTTEFIDSVDTSFYDSMTHFWPFDETAGMIDVFTNVNLTSPSTPSYVADRNGNLNSAIRVSGDTSYLQAQADNYFGSEFTITAWLYVYDYSISLNWPRLMDFGNGNNLDNVVITYSKNTVAEQGIPTITLVSSPSFYQPASYPITTGTWNHFALSINSTNVAFYINGISIFATTLPSPVPIITRSSNFFGRSNYGDSPSNVAFDEIKFFGKALSHQQIIYDFMRNSTPYTLMPSLNDSFSFSNLTTDQVVKLLKNGYDITDCSGNCSNHGSCLVKQKVLYCLCNTNYTGSTCATNLDPCFYSPCLNNGTCVSNMTDVTNTTLSVNYTCECDYPFSGANCEIKADVCVNTTCSHNGACFSNATNLPECKCFYLYSGENCETMSNKKKTITTIVAISSILAIVIIVSFYAVIVLMDVDTLYRQHRANHFKLNKPRKKTVHFQYIA